MSGRPLEVRLRRAMIGTTPWRWRAGQAAVALPLLLVATLGLGLGPGLAVALALGAVRVGGGVILGAGGRRREAALERAAPLLARCVGSELAGGAAAAQALGAAAGPVLRAEPRVRPLLTRALDLAALGEVPGVALADAAVGEEAGSGGMVAVAALLELAGRSGGDPAAFDRLAAALEAAVATREDARALTAEARLAAVAVPVLAGVLGITLVVTDPAIGAGATSPLAAAVLAGCVSVAAVGSALARRMAVVP